MIQQRKILDNVSFSANNNQMVAIMGSSGSGKSTIANLIPRFYDAQSGDILIDNQSTEYKLQHLRSAISIVNQSPSLFNDTIENNIAYGSEAIDQEKLEEASSLSGCDEFISYPNHMKQKLENEATVFPEVRDRELL